MQPVDLSRLCTAMQLSRRRLERYRTERRLAVEQYVGAHYSDSGRRKIVPVNLISLYTQIVSRNLIAKAPRVLLSTFNRQAKPAVAALQVSANREIEAMYLANTLQRAVLDALFSIGIVKTALATPADAAMYAYAQDAGQPFSERVDLDDFVYDTNARDFSEVSYIGHRYRAPLEVIRDSKLYSKARKDLVASDDSPYNHEGDERISTIGRNEYTSNTEEFEPLVDLWEVFLSRRRIVLTLTDDQVATGSGLGADRDGEALREQDWLGPECGPYKMLGYGIVPGNAMPKGSVQDLIDIHNLVNRIYRKLGNQADRQKEVVFVRSGSVEDGERLLKTNDGEAMKSDDPASVKAVGWGGPNQQNQLFGIHMKELFSWLGGNLDMMGGLSPQSKTLGQDKMLEQNASRAISDMQDRTVQFASEVVKSLCWYWWHHPTNTLKTQHSAVPGMPELDFQRTTTPQQRQQVPWKDVDIKIDPYSMAHSTPASRLQTLNGIVQQVMPMMPMMQQQGLTIDLNAYLTKVGQYADMPDLAEIITIHEPPPPEQDQGDQPDEPGMPAETTRNYERRSLGGESSQAKDATMAAMLQGGSAKSAETNGVMGAMGA